MLNRTWISLLLALSLTACQEERVTRTPTPSSRAQVATAKSGKTRAAAAKEIDMTKIEKSEAEWKAQLSDEEYYVTRQKGTERAFTGRYWDEKSPGTYHCVACDLPLFSSETKFKSGTGWPSFYQPIGADRVASETDRTLGMVRTEALCKRCDAHLGHVFPDGPKPTGQRFCINSASLKLKKEPPSE